MVALLEVGGDTLFQVAGLADVEHVPAAASMRYTPGRLGRPAMKVAASNMGWGDQAGTDRRSSVWSAVG